ncbi:L-threonylcarbamoyladenylate synthase [Miniphocaeibacter massiliensis]|uniref:L-threonylcarbamoyladenylate synthase n=1 Tax=Miniphocaeibacter massiliensis TaxID=2041841 RepID=UPI000C06C854|nr:L-threonylcarbamoyladenylate synthase [Miniphocaeibacter massiliensis]
MKTEIAKIETTVNTEALDINRNIIKKAAKYLRKNELVAIPTETVYGLGASGLSEEACKKIFEVKGRPADNPLILHISELEELYDLVKEVPIEAEKMLEELWPGPLTIVLRKSEKIPNIVTAGGNTVAIRMPSHKVAREIIKEVGLPIAAPSANLSGRPSPTTAKDVMEDLNGKINLIVDGGQSSIGIESTVLDLTSKPYTILRPGFFDKVDLENYLKEVEYDNALLEEGVIPRSPGQKYKHYAPKASMEVIIGNNKQIKEFIVIYIKSTIKNTAYILFEENKNLVPKDGIFLTLGSKEKLNEMAYNLFKNLRLADKLKVEHIICEGTLEKGIGIGIMNRLKKSSSGTVRIL